MMLDEENRAAEEAQAAHNAQSDTAGGSSPSNNQMLDDDGHIKRRASPTELNGAGLTKRASFRKGSRSSRGLDGAVTPLQEDGRSVESL